MKRPNNLIQKIADIDNLYLAFYKSAKGKKSKKEVIKYTDNLDKNLFLLKKQILSGNIEIGNYKYFKIYDPKEREICAASFPERVLHHAVMNICHKYFENYQINESYATRINKGTHKAIKKTVSFNRKYDYYLKLDIKKYFDSIDHKILFNLLEKRFKDKQLLEMFNKIIKNYKTNKKSIKSPRDFIGKERHFACQVDRTTAYSPQFQLGYDNKKNNKNGLPIGNLTSQYFANHYLALLDHYIKDELRIKGFVRYMDDMIIWHNDKEDFKNIQSKIKLFIENRLNLVLKISNLNKVSNGYTFLGYKLKGSYIKLSNNSKKRFTKKMKLYNYFLKNEIWSEREYQNHILPLISFTDYATNIKALRIKYI